MANLNLKKTSVITGYINLLVGIFLLSSNFIVGNYGKAIPPWQLTFLRFLIAFLIILPIAFSSLKKAWPILKSHWHLLLVYGTLGIAIPGGFAYISLHETSAVNGAFIFTSSPIFTLIIAWLLIGEKLTPLQWLGVMITLVGVLIIICKGNTHLLLHMKFTTGDLWMLANAICWAVYTVLIKHWKIAIDPLALLTSMILMGLLVVLPFCVAEILHHALITINPRNILTVLYAGTIGGAFAYFYYIRGVIAVGAAKTGLLIYLIPVFATLQAVLFLHETLHLYLLWAVIFMAAGILLTIFFEPDVISPSGKSS